MRLALSDLHGRLPATREDDLSLSLRTACGDVASELACTHDGTTAVDQLLSFPVVKDQTYYLFIDGATPFDSGSFSALLLLAPL